MNPLHLDREALLERLGERRYRRAEAYAASGAVRILAVENRRLAAFVAGEGGGVYAVEANENGEGTCTCPDFAETSACKHLGAVAMEADGLDPAAVRGPGGRLTRLREILAFETAEGLARLIERLAVTIPGVLEALESDPESVVRAP